MPSLPHPTLLLSLAALLSVACAGRAQDDVLARLTALSNEARVAEGASPLAVDPGLVRAAAGHARELAERGTLSHESRDPRRRTPALRVARAGVALVEVAENLAMIGGGDVAPRTVGGWLSSPSHRRNLLNDRYSHVGHAVVTVRDVHWVVQVLAARPLTRLAATATPAAPADGRSDGVVIEIRYDAPDAALALFVDGDHVPAAIVTPGVLRTTRPLADRAVQVSVGIDRGDGSARVVERFELRPGPPPTLVPGAPSDPAGERASGTT